MQQELREILTAGLAAADPEEAVRRSLRFEDGAIIAAGERLDPERVYVLAAGKAAPLMARAAVEILGERVVGGLVVAKDGSEKGPDRLEILFAAHPEPDERGAAAAERAGELAQSLGENNLLLALISGGASALLADPAGGITLQELKGLTGELLGSGASIGEINTVRKQLSTLKGGGLARLASPATTLALLLSDVVGDNPADIASGLTSPGPATPRDALTVLERYGIEPPQSVAERLEKAPAETSFPGGTINVVCASGRHTVEAAAEKSRHLGYTPLILSTTVTGDSRTAGSLYAAVIRELLESGNPIPPPCAVLSGGETTVSVRGGGTGGPNQEFALQMAVELDGMEGWAASAIDTDGGDGGTDAAGGMVDAGTAAKTRERGLNPVELLDDNDAYTALEAADALIKTGPTGTNVNDLRVALIRRV